MNRTIKIEELQAFIDSRSYGAPKAEDLTVGELLEFIKTSNVRPQNGVGSMVRGIEEACALYETCQGHNPIRLRPYPAPEAD